MLRRRWRELRRSWRVIKGAMLKAQLARVEGAAGAMLKAQLARVKAQLAHVDAGAS